MEEPVSISERMKQLALSAQEKYSDSSWLRAMVNLIPTIGGSIDILITSRHESIVKSRIENLVLFLKQKLETIDQNKLDVDYLESEEGHDLILTSFERVVKIKDRERIQAIAEIIVASISKEGQLIYHPIDSVMVLSELTTQEAFILSKVYDLYTKHFTLLEGSQSTLFRMTTLMKILPPTNSDECEVILDRLSGKGLLNTIFEYYSISEYAKHLVELVKLEYKY